MVQSKSMCDGLIHFFAEERKRLVRVFDERIGEAEEVVSTVTVPC